MAPNVILGLKILPQVRKRFALLARTYKKVMTIESFRGPVDFFQYQIYGFLVITRKVFS